MVGVSPHKAKLHVTKEVLYFGAVREQHTAGWRSRGEVKTGELAWAMGLGEELSHACTRESAGHRQQGHSRAVGHHFAASATVLWFYGC